MRRGDIVIVAPQGDYGKPRPAVVIQSDKLITGTSVLVVLLTSAIADTPIYRLRLVPDKNNGLRQDSEIMVDKITALPCAKIGAVIGSLDDGTLAELNATLAVMIGIAD